MCLKVFSTLISGCRQFYNHTIIGVQFPRIFPLLLQITMLETVHIPLILNTGKDIKILTDKVWGVLIFRVAFSSVHCK